MQKNFVYSVSNVGLQSTDFLKKKTQNCSNTLREDLPYRISPKSVNKYGNYGGKFVRVRK
jgi:hypothetical protein